MRTALTRLQQTIWLYRHTLSSRPCSQQGFAASCTCICVHPRRKRNTTHHAYHCSLPSYINNNRRAVTTLSLAASRRTYSVKSANIEPESLNAIPQIATERKGDPNAWIELFDPVLPLEYRKRAKYDSDLSREGFGSANAACGYVLKILDLARTQQHANTDLLAYMIQNGQKEAALYIVKLLLDNLVDGFATRSHECLPSNILWPETKISDMCGKPIEAAIISGRTNSKTVSDSNTQDDPRYTFMFSKYKQGTMTQIWSTLGSLVICSADLPDKEAAEINNALLLILGQIHSLDLVPENVYAYRRSSFSVIIQKPPILHLVSSRILTALSDATWRQQQDQIIEKTASLGVPYEEIGKDPPGGRFRLKVRPLSPEIWLEFILWCCVEGGFTSAGVRIIRQLKDRSEAPWYAVTWSPGNSNSHSSTFVDWSRVRARYGGSVGLKEGYSGDKPFVEMPQRTISTEVVLGLVDASINTINNNMAIGGGVAVVQRTIFDLVSILEPHDLPVTYFDYLAVRLMQSSVFSLPQDTDALRLWFKRLSNMKSIETISTCPAPMASLSLDSLLTQSETHAGVLHQIIDGYVQLGNMHRALSSFNELQELVDRSKLQAIGSFLNESSTRQKPEKLRGKPSGIALHEFVGSHGELPTYKLMGLLELATDTGLTGFGQWLLYSEGPDGPLIPQSAYQNPGLARSLVRFAALTRDKTLVEKVIQAQKRVGRRPTVTFLRALVNTYFTILDFKSAEARLRNLTIAQGGGFGLTNLANLAAAILKLESGNVHRLNHTDNIQALHYGRYLLAQILAGSFGEKSGSFRTGTRKMFRLQIAGILRIFQDFPESSLASIATQYVQNYPAPNRPCLMATNFNIFLEAALECRGPEKGIHLWEHFCQSFMIDAELYGGDFFADDDFVPASPDIDDADDMGESEGLIGDVMGRDHTLTGAVPQEFVPVVHEESWHSKPVAVLTTALTPRTSHTELGKKQFLENDGFSSSFFPNAHTADAYNVENQEDTGHEFNHLVIPNQRTLRLIIRSAVNMRRKNLKADEGAADYKKILDWAAKELKRFGATTSMISMELEDPLRQSQHRQLHNNQSGSQRLRASRKKSSVPVRRVEALFQGQHRSRLDKQP